MVLPDWLNWLLTRPWRVSDLAGLVALALAVAAPYLGARRPGPADAVESEADDDDA